MSRSRTAPEEALALEVMRWQAQDQLARGGLSEADRAALELRAGGNMWATPQMIEARVEANRETGKRQAEAEAPKAAAEAPEPPQSERPAQEVPKPVPRPKRRGRPPKDQLWMYEAAPLFVRGLTLRRAALRAGVTLSESELRNVYRWRLWRELVEVCRRERQRESGNFRD